MTQTSSSKGTRVLFLFFIFLRGLTYLSPPLTKSKPYQSFAYPVYYRSHRGSRCVNSRSGEPSKQPDPAELKLHSIIADCWESGEAAKATQKPVCVCET